MEFFNIPPEKLPPAYRHYFDRPFSREELTQRFIEDVKAHPESKEIIKVYLGSDEFFLKSYADLKAAVLLDSASLLAKTELHDTIFKTYAAERIWDIQQKKLFDLQCRWRAEQIKIQEVESTWDFHYWSGQIELCPFLPAITETEIETYKSFLESCTIDLTTVYADWQEYSEYKRNYQSDELGFELPEWYEYHNNVTGNGILLTLPDIRGEKEEFYRRIWFDNEYKETSKQKFESAPIPDLDELQEKLMKKIESPEFIKMYKRYQRLNDLIDSQDEVEDAYQFLIDLNHPVPIEAHEDWREGIISSKNKYVNKMIAAEMGFAFDQYQLKRSLGITGENKEDEKDFYESLKEPVRKGRKLNGEPPDFNF